MRLVAVPFASKVHGEEYYRGVLDEFQAHLNSHGVEVLEPVTDIEEAGVLAKKLGDKVVVPILLVLTGGSSRIARRFIEVGDFKCSVLLAHGEHNSLASAVSVRARLDIEGKPTTIFYCEELGYSCRNAINEAVTVAHTLSMLLRKRVGVIGRDDKDDEMLDYEMFADSETVPITYEELDTYLKNVDKESVDEVADVLSEKLGVDGSTITEIARLCAAMHRLVEDKSLNYITMDCFPYILRRGFTPCIPLAYLNSIGVVAGCEGDLQALALMVIARGLTGHSGWIANPSGFENGRLVLAHCTAAFDIVQTLRAVPHFESGRPLGIAASFGKDKWTLTSLSYDFMVLGVARARMVRSGMLSRNRCRTQAIVDIGNLDKETLLDMVPANHHVLMVADQRARLRRIAKLLSLEYLEYS